MTFHATYQDGVFRPLGKIDLPDPCDVEVEIRQVNVALQPARGLTSGPGLADVLDEIHQGQLTRGFQGRTADEIETGLREGDDDYEENPQVRPGRLASPRGRGGTPG